MVAVTTHAVEGEAAGATWPEPLSLTVDEGACIAIRTVPAFSAALFRLLLGATAPAGAPSAAGAASILVHGVEPASLSREGLRRFRTGIGSSLLPDGLVANLTLRANLVVPMLYSGAATAAEAAERADEVLAQFGLGARAESRPGELPEDQRQIAAVARAAVVRPRLLLLDNPLASLGSADVGPLLARCRAAARTMLVAVHRRTDALYRIADAVLLWDDDGLRTART